MSTRKGKKKSDPKKIYLVNGESYISLCETCKHKPAGKVPQSNTMVREGLDEQPHMYCKEKAFFPSINWADGTGDMFLDVAKCDGYASVNQDNNK
jgi:hypothetical protein